MTKKGESAGDLAEWYERKKKEAVAPPDAEPDSAAASRAQHKAYEPARSKPIPAVSCPEGVEAPGAGGEIRIPRKKGPDRDEEWESSEGRARQKADQQIPPTPLPPSVHALFLLVDIASPARETRGIPRYLPLEYTRTLVGTHAKAHVCLDDPETVRPKHAKVIYEASGGMREFVIYPIQDGEAYVNGRVVPKGGLVLRSGDTVEIGSAELLFFAK
jgi:ribosome-associated protein YbcJ (S4-like RNA binding protein)